MPPIIGIPAQALAAYRSAAGRQPGCGLAWTLLAGIGMIESGHAWGHGGSGARWNGIATPPVLGPVLNGRGFAAIPDTDHGALDGDRVWDRAVGPMQFLPSTWAGYAVDGDHDGRRNPQDIWDASAAAADYLCAATSITSPTTLVRAVFAYNHSTDYVGSVISAALDYGPLPYGQQALTVLDGLPVPEQGPLPLPHPGPVAGPTPSVPTEAIPLPAPSRTWPAPTTAGPSPSNPTPTPTVSAEPAASSTTSPTPSESSIPADSTPTGQPSG